MTAPDLPRAYVLLEALERTGPRPALAWYGEAARIELSGHVLANWVTKAIGHLDAELALLPGELVVLDVPPHWKRLVLALAAWSLGAEVRIPPAGADASAEGAAGTGPEDEEIRVLATDRPDSSLADDADEVLALDAVSLAPRFSGALPPLVHDWASEVRAHPDALGVPLPAWSGPAPAPVPADSDASSAPDARAPRLLVPDDGLPVVAETLGALLAGGGIVGPASEVDAAQAADEGVTRAL
ncbi:TIGR03089 family protein [Brachybacterium sp. DNPG3]